MNQTEARESLIGRVGRWLAGWLAGVLSGWPHEPLLMQCSNSERASSSLDLSTGSDALVLYSTCSFI